MASILRKIGLNPYLVSIPGHMFLAVDLDADGDKTIAVETTMMGDKADGPSDGVEWIPKKELKARRKAPGWFAFEAAVQTGNEELDDAWKKLEDPKEWTTRSSTSRRLAGWASSPSATTRRRNKHQPAGKKKSPLRDGSRRGLR